MEEQSSLCFIHLKGEYHSSDVDRIKSHFEPAQKANVVIINLCDVTCFDISCFFELFHLKDALVRRGGAVRIVMNKDYIKRLFMIGESEGNFEFFETLDEAMRFKTPVAAE